jgi:hypothetical protein
MVGLAEEVSSSTNNPFCQLNNVHKVQTDGYK